MKATLAALPLAALLAVSACDRTQASALPDSASLSQTTSDTAVSVLDASVTLKDGVYDIAWTTSALDTPVRIEASNNPDAAPGEGLLISENITASNFKWTPASDDAAERKYFIVTPANGEPLYTALRVLPLEGGRNFRDLGGYTTIDGMHVKWGKIYRSGVMTDLTSKDYDYLSDLNIKVVCDFRNSDERTQEPTNWAAGQIDYLTFPDVMQLNSSGLVDALKSPDAKPQDVKQAMKDLYPKLADDHAPMYAAMFDRLAAGEIPLAFNCAAGKDRTGVAAGLLLTALGVPREMILADYALSEQIVDYKKEFLESADAAPENDRYAWLRNLPPEMLDAMFRSDPDYLEAAFTHMETNFGSVDAYLKEKINVTDDELSTIRAQLLE